MVTADYTIGNAILMDIWELEPVESTPIDVYD